MKDGLYHQLQSVMFFFFNVYIVIKSNCIVRARILTIAHLVWLEMDSVVFMVVVLYHSITRVKIITKKDVFIGSIQE